ncbi:hypothetical protein QF031_002168 [Pseudarthrobacter defluvii]|nr:hypothetical protein [Pseudarthrobacter defluvii]
MAATGAMSVLLVAADVTGVMDYEPPRKIIDKFFPRLPLPLRNTAAIVAHFGYGIAGGSLFALARWKRPTVGTGLAYGAVVWAAGYEGWLPAMGILPPAHRDKPGRAVTVLVAHLLYGAVLGKALDRLTPAIPDGGGPEGEGNPLEEAVGKRSMSQSLPDSYVRYLADKDPVFIAAVLPVLEQSAATQDHGVHVRYLPGGIQALTDQAVPYPEVTEGVD